MTTPRLLATDLDGTFIGDDRSMSHLWRDLEHEGILIAFSTGRHLPSIEKFYVETSTTRRADACICMVGTEIWLRTRDSYEMDVTWSQLIAEAWNKPRMEEIVQSIPDVTMQPQQWQSGLKCSYFLEENAEVRIQEIKDRLERAGLQAKLVYSAGRFLDLLPYRSGKGEAVHYLAESLGIGTDDVVTAGDTGNDLDMMRPELGFRSVAVGNASKELRAYQAPNLYHAQLPYAAGIREGLVHHGWLRE